MRWRPSSCDQLRRDQSRTCRGSSVAFVEGSWPTRRLAARGESSAAFDERPILAHGVAPRSNTGGILARRALCAGRLGRLGATRDFHHGLPGLSRLESLTFGVTAASVLRCIPVGDFHSRFPAAVL